MFRIDSWRNLDSDPLATGQTFEKGSVIDQENNSYLYSLTETGNSETRLNDGRGSYTREGNNFTSEGYVDGVLVSTVYSTLEGTNNSITLESTTVSTSETAYRTTTATTHRSIPTVTTFSSFDGTETITTGGTTTTSATAQTTLQTLHTENYSTTGGQTFSSNTAGSYTSSRFVLSDCLTGTLETQVTGKTNYNGRVEISCYSFDGNEWPWSFTYDGGYEDWNQAVFALSDLADEIKDDTWKRTDGNVTLTQEDGDNTYEYTPAGYYILNETATLSITTTSATTVMSTGMNPQLHPEYDELPTPTSEVFQTTAITSTSFTETVVIATGTSAGNTSETTFTTTCSVDDGSGGSLVYTQQSDSTFTVTIPLASGCSSAATLLLQLISTFTVPVFVYDSAGRISDGGDGDATTIGATRGIYVTSASVVAAAPAPIIYKASSSDSAATSVEYYPIATGQGTSIYEAAAETLAFGAFFGQATVLEATISNGLRWGTDGGKCQQITGPEQSVYYPFFSRVWGNDDYSNSNFVWTPMTYNHTESLTWQGRVTSTEGNGDSNDPPVSFTLPDSTAPVSTLVYSWGKTGDQRGCNINAFWSLDGTGSVSSSSVSFVIGSQGEDATSFYSTRVENVAPTGNGVDGGQFAIGGSQWDNCDASAILGPGRWLAMSMDSTGGTQAETIEIDMTDVSMVTAQSDMIVAYRGLQAWACVNSAVLENQADFIYLGRKFELDPSQYDTPLQ